MGAACFLPFKLAAQIALVTPTRSPSSALSHPFFGRRVPLVKSTTEKMVLEDLAKVCHSQVAANLTRDPTCHSPQSQPT